MKAFDQPVEDPPFVAPSEKGLPIQGEATGEFHGKDVATFTIAHGAHDMYTSFVPPLLPLLIERFALSRTEAGMLSVFMRLPAFSQAFIGHLSDRSDLRYLVILAPAVTATLMTLIGYMPGYWTIVLLLVMVGFSSAGLHAVAPAVAVRLSGKNLGRGMSYWMVGGELGWTLGPIVAVTVVDLFTMRGLPMLAIVGWSASLFLFIRLRKFKDEKSVVVRTLPMSAILAEMKSIMLVILGILILRSFMDTALVIYLPTFMTERGIGLWLAGASVTIVQASGVIGTLIGGDLSDKIGRRLIVMVCLALPPLLMLLFLNMTGWYLYPMLFLMGFAAFAINPVFLALVLESFPENRALANGIYLTMSFVINALAIFVMGIAGDTLGLETAYRYSSIIMLFAIPMAFFLPRNKSASPQR